MTATRRLLGTRARLSIALPPWRAHRPVRIELIGVNDGPSASRDHVADGRATAVAQSLTKAGVDPATITRAGQEKPAGSGIATHEVVIRFEDSAPTVQTGSLEYHRSAHHPARMKTVRAA